MNLPQKPQVPPSVIAAVLAAGAALAKFILGFIKRKKIDKASDEEAALGAAEDVVDNLPNVISIEKDKK